MTADRSGILDEALERLHRTGPEREGWLSNHAPMAVEALSRHGHGDRVHPWLDSYRDKLEDPPPADRPIDPVHWRHALGDPARLGDWRDHFLREVADHGWREVLVRWWPRLLPGITASATHPVIRVGHAVRTLLAAEPTAPRTAELAHALGYWAARHAPLPRLTALPAPADPVAALAAVPPVPDRDGGVRERLARLRALPDWPATAATAAADRGGPVGPVGPVGPEAVPGLLAGLVRAATEHYGRCAHGEPVMLVHAATAPNAVLRTLPALPRELWPDALRAAWRTAAAVTAAYAPDAPQPATRATGAELFARAAAHGDEHAVKFADTALDVVAAAERAGADPGPARAAVLRACALIEPVG